MGYYKSRALTRSELGGELLDLYLRGDNYSRDEKQQRETDVVMSMLRLSLVSVLLRDQGMVVFLRWTWRGPRLKWRSIDYTFYG